MLGRGLVSRNKRDREVARRGAVVAAAEQTALEHKRACPSCSQPWSDGMPLFAQDQRIAQDGRCIPRGIKDGCDQVAATFSFGSSGFGCLALGHNALQRLIPGLDERCRSFDLKLVAQSLNVNTGPLRTWPVLHRLCSHERGCIRQSHHDRLGPSRLPLAWC